MRSLRLFLDLSEEGNFSALARRQHISHTTVARAIDDLEAHFGVRLFQRSTRALRLTRDGERLVDHAAIILGQLDQAEAELAGSDAARGLVRIGVTTALGLHYAERLALLHARHPGLSAEMLVADWRAVADDSGLDLWLSVGEARGEGTTALGLLPRILVAAPAYVAAQGAPLTVEDLPAHRCLSYGYEAHPSPWPVDGREWRVGGFLRANSSEAVRRAMRGGLGIALLPRIQVEEDLARGLAVQILPDAAIPPVAVTVSHGFRGMRLPVRVRAVTDFLVEHFPEQGAGKCPHPGSGRA
ncbi:MAG: LysR family transcriptional regulator [Sphingobium sp.]